MTERKPSQAEPTKRPPDERDLRLVSATPAHAERGDEPERAMAPYALAVRQVRLIDLPALGRLSGCIALNEPRVQEGGCSPVSAALAAIAPGRNRPHVFVAKSNSRLVGFAHFEQGGKDQRWRGIAIGVQTGVYGAEPVWEELLRHATIAAGLSGVKRLYVKAASGSPLLAAFSKAGYAVYATETVFITQHPVVDAAESRLRRQEAGDAWAIHQLYNAATPKQVQYAEAFTSDRWDVPRAHSGKRFSGWLLEEGNSVIGFVRIGSAGNDHRLDVLHHPEHPKAARVLIGSALAKLRGVESGRVCCAVRGYQAEAATALEARGFDPVLEQDLLIKYTAAVARPALAEGAVFPAELIERLPKRAPSFPFGASVGDQGK